MPLGNPASSCPQSSRASAKKRAAARSSFSIPIRRWRKRLLAGSPFQAFVTRARQRRDSFVHAPRKMAGENVFRAFQRAFTKLSAHETRCASHASYGLRQRFRTPRQWILLMPFIQVAGT